MFYLLGVHQQVQSNLQDNLQDNLLSLSKLHQRDSLLFMSNFDGPA